MRFLFCIAVFALCPLWAGDIIHMEETDLNSKKVTSEQFLIQDGKMRIEMDQDGSYGIFDAEKREFYMVQPGQKKYMVINLESMKEAGEAMGSAMAQVQEQMKQALAAVPEDQRARMEEMMKQRMGAMMPSGEAITLEMKDMGQTKSIQGIKVSQFDLMINGQKESENWVGDWSQMDLSKESVATMKGMMSLFSDMAEEAAKIPGFDQFVSGMGSFKDMMGFPVITTRYDGGLPKEEIRLKKIENTNIATELLEIPADYQRIEMSDMLRGGR